MKTQKEFDEFILACFSDSTRRDIDKIMIGWEACEKVLIKKLSNCMNCKYERITEASSNNEQYPCFVCNNLSLWEMED